MGEYGGEDEEPLNSKRQNIISGFDNS